MPSALGCCIFSLSFHYNLAPIGVLEFVVVIDVYAQPTREKIKFYRTASETGRRLSVTPPQVAHIGSTDGSHDEQRNTVEVSPEEHAGAVRSDRRAD